VCSSDLSKIVPIQLEGAKSPFFMVRPLPIYRPLAHRLPGDRPFLGVSLPERQELPQQYGVCDVARELVRVVRRWQPFGPYYLGGWCADGVVAYEMACQIEAQGDQVAVLALFDSLNPAYMKGLSPWQSLKQRTQLLVWNSRFHLASLRQLGKSEIPGYIGQRLAAVLTLARRKLSGAFRYATRSEQSQKESEWRPSGLRVWIRGYQPKPVPGPVVLFRSAGWSSRSPEDPSFGWGALVSHRLTIHQIPGNHLSIFLEPNVGVLAEKLAAHLAETTPADIERPAVSRRNENKS